MSGTTRLSVTIAVIGGIAFAIAYTGFVRSYLDHETQTTFFIKRYATWKMEFHDPFANEGDDVPIDKLRPSDRARFAEYCKYRFGIVERGTAALTQCKSEIPRYLR